LARGLLTVNAGLALPAAVRQNLLADAGQVAEALAARVADLLREALALRGRATLIVSGGRTPAAFQQALSDHALDWSRVTVSLADDRWVAGDHPDSNARLVRENLLRGRAAAARFVPLANADVEPVQHLASAEKSLAALQRPFDAVLLGMGEDGHIASLFPGAPGTAAAMDRQRPEQLALVSPTQAPHRRITLSLRALLDTRALLLLIQGEAKRAAIERAGAASPQLYPVSAVLQQNAVPVELYYCP